MTGGRVMRVPYFVVLRVLSPLVATQVMVAPQSPPADAASALACIQNALGGTAAFAAVSSLHIKAEMRPSQDSGMRPLLGTREINVVFPDQYRRDEVGRPPDPGESELRSAAGFDGGVVLSYPRHPDPKLAAVLARQDFERQMLMRLPRQLASVSLSQRVTTDSGHERLAIDASGTGGTKSTLLVNRDTCVPLALLYNTVTPSRSGVARVDLSGYRTFGRVRFPTVLKTSIGGEPYREERVTLVEVNSPAAAKAFSSRR